jgi:hypothetical protein
VAASETVQHDDSVGIVSDLYTSQNQPKKFVKDQPKDFVKPEEQREGGWIGSSETTVNRYFKDFQRKPKNWTRSG